MSLKGTFHIQSRESRERVINTFCRLIFFSSLLSSALYVYLRVFPLMWATALIGACFAFFIVLNKKGRFAISRAAIITITNMGVLMFSLYLGYECGIYLYLLVAPLLIYLLFDLSEKKQILIAFTLYMLTFLVCFAYPQPVFGPSPLPGKDAVRLIYSFNFYTVLVLSLALVSYFALNNHRYIANLESNQELLVEAMNLRVQSEDLLKKSLTEREVLLAEVHHRVKNNMAIVSSLINLQIDNLQEEKSKDIFRETHNRIHAMSLIHNLLYQNKSFSNIDFSDYTQKFCRHLSSSYAINAAVEFDFKLERISIDVKTAVPLALILNELITNSFKHAFKDGKNGKISIGLTNYDSGTLKFWISDTGCGMDEHFLSEGNMGMDIVRSLTEQVDGEIKYRKENGSNFTFLIPSPSLVASN